MYTLAIQQSVFHPLDLIRVLYAILDNCVASHLDRVIYSLTYNTKESFPRRLFCNCSSFFALPRLWSTSWATFVVLTRYNPIYVSFVRCISPPKKQVRARFRRRKDHETIPCQTPKFKFDLSLLLHCRFPEHRSCFALKAEKDMKKKGREGKGEGDEVR